MDAQNEVYLFAKFLYMQETKPVDILFWYLNMYAAGINL